MDEHDHDHEHEETNLPEDLKKLIDALYTSIEIHGIDEVANFIDGVLIMLDESDDPEGFKNFINVNFKDVDYSEFEEFEGEDTKN